MQSVYSLVGDEAGVSKERKKHFTITLLWDMLVNNTFLPTTKHFCRRF